MQDCTVDLRRLWRAAPPGLAAVYLLKLLEGLAYFAGALNLTVYLTRNLGYSDRAAGWLYAAWGLVAGLASILSGPLIDVLGPRRALRVGAACRHAIIIIIIIIIIIVMLLIGQ